MTGPNWDRVSGRVLQSLREHAEASTCPTCGDFTYRPMRQRDVAKLLGVTQATVSNFETGRSWPSEPQLLAMLRHYRTSWDRFWNLVDEERGEAA